MSRRKSRKKFAHKRRARKSKIVKVDPFIFLPDDILLEILKRLPDAVLRYKAKYVCSRWFNIITNSILLDHASYILQNMGTFRTCLVDIREEGERLQVKEQDLDLDIPHIGMITSWCNEFLLISVSYTNTLYVYNLITKEGSYLPQHNAPCGRYCIGNCGVALSGFKGIYKVVHLYSGPPIKCHILNLGRGDNLSCVSSKWKHVKGSFTKDVKNRLHSWCEPVLVRQGRYIHWETFNDSNDLVSMDTETEEIFQKRLPRSIEERYYGNSLFVIGGFLAVFDRVYQGNDAYVWILKDFRRKRWKKLQLITGHYTRYLDTYRICGGISKRYIILRSRTGKGMCSYDVKNGVFKELDISIGSDHDHFVVHSSAPIKI